ncbi:VOC family protein [uncultured Devosia sp.]|uniref:VOC family protein n=1 Tax=uncultured Devosia sp. TaxID=211434 RepID=UPI0035CB9D60
MTDAPVTSGLTPYLSIDGVTAAIAFYERAFAATAIDVRQTDSGDGRVIHAHLQINGAPLFMSDFFPDYGYPAVAPAAFMLHLQVADAQAWWDRAVAAGCTVKSPIKVEFWGDIYGQLSDPHGVTWAIGQTVAK